MKFLQPVQALGLSTLVALTLFFTSAHAQPADTAAVLRLEDLLQEAQANNPSLQANRLKAEAQATKSAQVSALPDPSVNVSYQPRPILTARGYQRSQWRLEQTIPFPGKRRLRGKVASLGADIAASNADAVGEDLILQVKQAYYELYRVQEQQQVLATFQEELRSFEQAALRRYEVGNGTQQAVLKAQLERSRLEVRQQQLAEDRRSALETLARLLDRPNSNGLTGTLRVEKPQLPTNNQLVEHALQQRPEAEALRQAATRSKQKIALARREFLPDLSVGLTYMDLGAGGPSPTMTGRDAVTLSAGIKIPLWRGKLNAQLEEARLQKQQVGARYQAFETDLRAQIHDLQNRLHKQQEQLTLLEKTLVPQAETTLEATLSAYTTDQADFLDLLDAERTLFSLQMDYETTYARYLKTAAALTRTLGVSNDDWQFSGAE